MSRYIVSIIPARGGSERLPRKNVATFCGKPLITWSILQSVNSLYVDRTFVITDDLEISDISKSYGAEVLIQPPWQCRLGTMGGTTAVINATGQLEEQKVPLTDFVLLLPNYPLRKPDDIDRIVAEHVRRNAINSNAVAPMRHIALQQEDAPGHVTPVLGGNNGVYLSAGCLLTVSAFDAWRKSLFGIGPISVDDYIRHRTKPLPITGEASRIYVEEWQTQEIDYYYELRICETLMWDNILSLSNVYDEYGSRKLFEE